jgi:homoaconitase/3-isopropylmalate dehydratase large subunit
MATTVETAQSTRDTQASSFQDELRHALVNIRSIDLAGLDIDESVNSKSIPELLSQYSLALEKGGKAAEAEAFSHVREKVIDSTAFGGLGLKNDTAATQSQQAEALFLAEAWLEAINSHEKARNYLSSRPAPATGTKPMTLAQKIFAQHVLGQKPEGGLEAGDVVRVGIDWILASELSWQVSDPYCSYGKTMKLRNVQGMERVHKELGSPGVWRNDRFWLAGDHVVHPAALSHPKIQGLVKAAETAKKQFKMTEYQGMNYTIMHTEFVRERIEPGMLALGSDSHTCSGGAVGCLSIGLGGADVMMALSVGETWFKIPDSIFIEFVGQPGFGMSGKDVILYILGELKRNTVAAERIVEFGGEGLKHLSIDARFAIANMCTEFGAITGIFVPDQVTKEYISRRRRKANKTNSLYFQPDSDAQYAGRYTIDLSKVESSIAVYPNPDDVVAVSNMAGKSLDGVFIGACTTTEEELVLAALVLKAGLAKNLPMAQGKRHYVPGSLPIVEKLKSLKLLEIYEAAGFTRGPPGCSYCVGLSAEKANAGETWLSSQNRNFQNRMGPGKCPSSAGPSSVVLLTRRCAAD